MNRSKPKAILFDFGGTLDSDGIPWKERFYPLYHQVGIDWDLVSFERFFYASDDSLTEERLGEVGYEAMLFEHVCRVLRNGDRYDGCWPAEFPETSIQIPFTTCSETRRCFSDFQNIIAWGLSPISMGTLISLWRDWLCRGF